MRADVERSSLIGRLRGFGGARGYLRQCHGAGWALAGDAGYFKDPLTAHGITDALRDAELLSRAVTIASTQALERYQHERDALSLPFLRITDAIASFSRSLDKVKELHAQLSAVMKAEASHVAGFVRSPSLAAQEYENAERFTLDTNAGRPARAGLSRREEPHHHNARY